MGDFRDRKRRESLWATWNWRFGGEGVKVLLIIYR